MPGSSNSDTYVTVTVSPDRSRALVKRGGDLDPEACPELDDAVDRQTVAVPERVDVAAVTRAGALLPRFPHPAPERHTGKAMLTVPRPSPWASLVLRVTDRA